MTNPPHSTADMLKTFKNSMASIGLIAPDHLIADGKIHRCPTESRQHKRDGAYILHLDNLPAGCCINHRTGEKKTWHAASADISDAGLQRLKADARKRAARREQQRERTQRKIQNALPHIIAALPDATDHPYLTRKGIKAYGIKTATGAHLSREWCTRTHLRPLTYADDQPELIIPMRDADGTLSTLQRIRPDGTKLLLPQAKKHGTYFIIPCGRGDTGAKGPQALPNASEASAPTRPNEAAEMPQTDTTDSHRQASEARLSGSRASGPGATQQNTSRREHSEQEDSRQNNGQPGCLRTHPQTETCAAQPTETGAQPAYPCKACEACGPAASEASGLTCHDGASGASAQHARPTGAPQSDEPHPNPTADGILSARVWGAGSACRPNEAAQTQRTDTPNPTADGIPFARVWGQGAQPLVVCEGYATGASIFAATGHTVIIAGDCGNILPVAQTIRRQNPRAPIIIAADNDIATPGNPGLTHAEAAAKTIGATVIAPQPIDGASTDWNDIHRKHGLDTIRQTFTQRTPMQTKTPTTQTTQTKAPQTPWQECRASAPATRDQRERSEYGTEHQKPATDKLQERAHVGSRASGPCLDDDYYAALIEQTEKHYKEEETHRDEHQPNPATDKLQERAHAGSRASGPWQGCGGETPAHLKQSGEAALRSPAPTQQNTTRREQREQEDNRQNNGQPGCQRTHPQTETCAAQPTETGAQPAYPCKACEACGPAASGASGPTRDDAASEASGPHRATNGSANHRDEQTAKIHTDEVPFARVWGPGGHPLVQNDTDNADLLIADHGADLLYASDATDPAAWHWWNGTCWQPNAHPIAYTLLVQTLRATPDPEQNDTSANARAFRKHKNASLNEPRLTATLRAASRDPRIRIDPARLDTRPWLLNTQNCTIDLKNMKTRPHRRDDHLTKTIPVAYTPDAQCPTWNKFITTVTCGDQHLAHYLQRIIGYSLTGDTSEQTLFILHGKGRNGKSLFLKVIATLLGDYARQGVLDAFMQKNTSGPNDAIADLKGARFVAMSEAAENARLQENLIKQITGGERITARKLYENYSEYTPEFKIFIATNHKPRITDTTYGMWRRIKLIPFNAVISDADEDPHLYEKLTAELPGILAWAVRGCGLWQREGGLRTNEPECVKYSTEEYKNEMDKLGTFLKERTVCTNPAEQLALAAIARDTEPDFTTSAQLYAAYRAWCDENGEKPMAKRTLSIKLKERGLVQGRRRMTGPQVRGWIGVRLLTREETYLAEDNTTDAPF